MRKLLLSLALLLASACAEDVLLGSELAQDDGQVAIDSGVELGGIEQASCVAPCRYTPQYIYMGVDALAGWSGSQGCVGSTNRGTFNSFQSGGTKARYTMDQFCIKRTQTFNSCTPSGAGANCDGQYIACPWPPAVHAQESAFTLWSGESFGSAQPGTGLANWSWSGGSFPRSHLWNVAWPGQINADQWNSVSIIGAPGAVSPACLYRVTAGFFDMDEQ